LLHNTNPMPANKYALIRYRVIDKCLTNRGRPFPSREELRAACQEALFGSGGDDISLSTIDKDIWAMKNESELGYYAPIEYNRAQKGYFYADPVYSISQLTMGEEDMQAIRFAAATLEQFRNVPLFEQYESAIEKIINRVNISAWPDSEKLDKFIQFEKSTVSRGNDYLGPLLEAIQQHRSVRIIYRKFTDDQSKEYELQPYLLKEYQNRWYLIAREANRGAIRTFGLERMEHLETAEKGFEPDPSFRPELFFEYSIGITEKPEQPSKVLLKLSKVAGRFLLTQPIHATQYLVEENDTYITIGLHVLLTEELYSWILSRGYQCEILEPSSLREEIRDRLRQAMSVYG
jgi:predicted DNA-binding transcriptional regulator YafY